MNKRDMAIIVSLIGLALLTFALTFMLPKVAASQIIARVNDVEILRAPLNIDNQYRMESENGYNIISVISGSARVIEADCPGGACIRQGAISSGGQAIVCLPHGLIIEAISDKNTEGDLTYDVIAG